MLFVDRLCKIPYVSSIRRTHVVRVPICNRWSFCVTGGQGRMSRSCVQILKVSFWQICLFEMSAKCAWNRVAAYSSFVEARRPVMTGRRVTRDVHRDDVLAFWWSYDSEWSIENEQSPSTGASASGGWRRWRRSGRRNSERHGTLIASSAEQRASETAFLDLRVSM